MKVLIAEDDATTRLLLQRIVRGFGHEVVSAADGEEAWYRFVAGDFNFVLTDWMMPGCDGLELCRRIRSAGRTEYVYVIMITASGGAENLIAGLSAGADDFVVKPVNDRALQVRMRAAERILTLQHELHEKNRQLETLNDRLRHLSRLDALTQLGNRLAFDEALADAHHRASRYATRYALLMCDVDNFKRYNDTHGHPAGDDVLRRIGAAVKACLRASDAAFRYGGEEIAILLAGQSVAEAAVLAERLRRTVEDLEPPQAPRLTLSCGVAACPLDGRSIPEADVVVRWADEALYRAKAAGRNRIETAPACAPATV